MKPATCVTIGMISALPGGKVFPCGATGVTRLIDTGTFAVCPVLVVTVTVPVFAPGGSEPGEAVTVTSTLPLGGTVPDGGLALRYGLSVLTANVALSSALAPAAASFTCSGTSNGVLVPNGTTASVPRAVDGGAACTTIETVDENGPVEPEHCCAWTR